MLDISEIFGPTIQGEGRRVGRPSVFIRFARCNFSCAGFAVEYVTPSGETKQGCDTYYAVDPCFKKQWQRSTTEQIIDRVEQLAADVNYPIDIVITGGEPLLFWKRKAFQALLKHFVDLQHVVTIETNASLDIVFDQPFQQNLVFSMSVKLLNSGEQARKRINLNALKTILTSSQQSYFKFVVDKQNAEQCIEEIQRITSVLPITDVYLMAQGDTVSSLNKNDQAIIDLCIEHNYIYADRTHIRIWDDQRGV